MKKILVRQSRRADPLGRYYTSNWVSETLVARLEARNPRIIMELGAGAGALSGAARMKWKNAKLITVDLDSRIFESNLSVQDENVHQHYIHDVLDSELNLKISQNLASIDVSLCNPPYIRPRWKKGFEKILEDAGLTSSLKSVREAGADLLFLAQNLRFLREGGKLGIILPDGLITGEKFLGVRKNLLSNQTIKSVIQLPTRVFKKTEAQTYLVVITKKRCNDDKVELYNFEAPGVLSPPITITTKEAESRLDYKHHYFKQKCRSKSTYYMVRDYCESLVRGNVSSADLQNVEYPVFHLNNFEKGNVGKSVRISSGRQVAKLQENQLPKFSKVARPGDILLARVGRNLPEKVVMVESGSCVISDCIFALRVKEEKKQEIFSFLKSEEGKGTLNSLVRGVGANYISKNDILNIKIENATSKIEVENGK